MAERREQEKPLALAIPANSKLSPFPPEFISHRRHQCLKCCGCSAALLLILAVTTLILMLTIFHVKHPTAASFKFHEAATKVYYDGALVGEGIAEETTESGAGRRRKEVFQAFRNRAERLQRLREEEKRESEAKALLKKQLQQDHQSKDTKSSSSDPNSNTDTSKSKPESTSSKSLDEEQNIDNLNLEGNKSRRQQCHENL
ncbi:hypothetical protein SASPL_117923 [Salvia splendens]|uniref:Uncharacterized protein n=1 Tax=Salvia splendens TaxID=180675 RepID=A0A8X8XZC0_SALSN|nr:hypothetical protein SASPL_117923 [Salvia splendens]